MINRTCQHCGASYQTYPSIRLKYCSQACTGAAKVRGQLSNCAVCGKEVWSPPSRPHQYCSKSCARTAANLTSENPSYSRDITGERNPMYGKGLIGAANPMYGKRRELSPRWNGGRRVRSDGYILVAVPDANSETKYVLEHRLVMECILERCLEPTEVVHHRDGNPSNNNLDNLKLFTDQSKHIHSGHGEHH